MRWIENVMARQYHIMKVTGWSSKSKGRTVWRYIVEEAKAHLGL